VSKYFKRFDDYSESITETGCKIWMGRMVRNGYGSYYLGKNQTMSAHRFAYENRYGPIPDGMCVCHRCDVRSCVNPDHLFLGTALENILDKVSKGRQTRGEAMHTAKLTREKVLEIRRIPRVRGDRVALAAIYGVVPDTISDIRCGKSWGFL